MGLTKTKKGVQTMHDAKTNETDDPPLMSPGASLENEFNQLIGKTLRARRDLLGLSVQTVASAIAVPPASIVSMESAVVGPTIARVMRVCPVLGLMVEDLTMAFHGEIQATGRCPVCRRC